MGWDGCAIGWGWMEWVNDETGARFCTSTTHTATPASFHYNKSAYIMPTLHASSFRLSAARFGVGLMDACSLA